MGELAGALDGGPGEFAHGDDDVEDTTTRAFDDVRDVLADAGYGAHDVAQPVGALLGESTGAGEDLRGVDVELGTGLVDDVTGGVDDGVRAVDQATDDGGQGAGDLARDLVGEVVRVGERARVVATGRRTGLVAATARGHLGAKRWERCVRGVGR